MKKEDRRSAEVIPFPRTRRETPAEPADEPKTGPGARIVAAIVHFKARSGAVRQVIGLLPRWVTPNGVTVFRGLLIAPIVLLMRDGLYLAALLTLAFAMLLDFVDGALAHVRNMRSETGAFLDPLADKVLVCGVLIAALPHLPGWAWIPVTAVCAFAGLLTLHRVVKLATAKRRAQDVDGKHIAASSTGKMKLLAETACMFLLLGGLALGSTAVVTAALVALCAAAVLGALSLLGHLRRS